MFLNETLMLLCANIFSKSIERFDLRGHLITVVYKSDELCLIEKLNNISSPLFLVTPDSTSNNLVQSSSYIFLMDEPVVLNKTLGKLNGIDRNPETKFLIVGNKQRNVKAIMELFRSNGIVNVSVALWLEAKSDFEFHFWNPYDLENQCGKRVVKTVNSFYEINYKNLNRCKFRVGYFLYHPNGFDFEDDVFFRTFGERYNLKIR